MKFREETVHSGYQEEFGFTLFIDDVEQFSDIFRSKDWQIKRPSRTHQSPVGLFSIEEDNVVSTEQKRN